MAAGIGSAALAGERMGPTGRGWCQRVGGSIVAETAVFTQSVADTADGFDQHSAVAEFLAECSDVNIHSPFEDQRVTECQVDQLGTAECAAGLSHQGFQQSEFAGCQIE